MNKLVLVSIVAWCFSLPALAADTMSLEDRLKGCAGCHGEQGNKPILPDYPRLAGQYESYLLRALKDYKSGARKNGIMNGMAGVLSDKEIAELAAYFSNQKGPLHVIR